MLAVKVFFVVLLIWLCPKALCNKLCPGAPESSYGGIPEDSCDPPTNCLASKMKIFPTKDPTKFYVCVNTHYEVMSCPEKTCFDLKHNVCVHSKDWIDKCDRREPTTTELITEPTTTTTTIQPYSGKICPGADPSKVTAGTDTCKRPSCFFELNRSEKKSPSKEPAEYYECWFIFFARKVSCEEGTCFDKTRQMCVGPSEWTNSCL